MNKVQKIRKLMNEWKLNLTQEHDKNLSIAENLKVEKEISPKIENNSNLKVFPLLSISSRTKKTYQQSQELSSCKDSSTVCSLQDNNPFKLKKKTYNSYTFRILKRNRETMRETSLNVSEMITHPLEDKIRIYKERKSTLRCSTRTSSVAEPDPTPELDVPQIKRLPKKRSSPTKFKKAVNIQWRGCQAKKTLSPLKHYDISGWQVRAEWDEVLF